MIRGIKFTGDLKMNDDTITITSSSTLSKISLDSYISDGMVEIHTPDSISITGIDYDEYNQKRMDVKDYGKIPIDIWARMYNNGSIND